MLQTLKGLFTTPTRNEVVREIIRRWDFHQILVEQGTHDRFGEVTKVWMIHWNYSMVLLFKKPVGTSEWKYLDRYAEMDPVLYDNPRPIESGQERYNRIVECLSSLSDEKLQEVRSATKGYR